MSGPSSDRTPGYTPLVDGSRTPGRGLLITLEGPEGSGKTTQATALVESLTARGIDVESDPRTGRDLARRAASRPPPRAHGFNAPTDPLTDALLFNAARRQLVSEVIRPALDAGRTIVCARFADSTLAYQGYGSGLDLDRLRALEAIATDGLVPDLTILLDLPVEDGLARKTPEDETRFEREFDLGLPPPGARRIPRAGRWRPGPVRGDRCEPAGC